MPHGGDKMNEVLGLILARGGSKSIPKKSIALCGGMPLLYYTSKAASLSQSITRLVISTDDDEMASVAREHGVEVPFMRPQELGGDHVLDHPVVLHALETLKEREGYRPQVVVHLRPTTPLKKSADIDRAVKMLLENTEAESVRSICEPLHTPFKMYRHDEGDTFLNPLLAREYASFFHEHREPYNMPRQVLPKIWRHSGYVDVVRPVVVEGGSMSGVKILPLYFESWRDVDIDSRRDLTYADLIIQDLKREGKNPWE